MESLQQALGRSVVALQLPIGTERGFRGVIDLVAMKAHFYIPDGDGKPKIEEIPAALAEDAKEAHERLVEMVAEGDDELMEEFFREGTIPIEDLIPGVRQAIVAEKIVPVLMISADHNIGNSSLLTFLADVFPHPDEHEEEGYAEPRGKGDRVPRKYDDSQPLSIFVFKTMADPFAGRINYFKVKSGVLKNDASVTNFGRGATARMQHIQVVQGKTIGRSRIFGDNAKKQSGGHGQFGVGRVKFEPAERNKGIEFVDDIFGGAIPHNWIPSVERGIRESAARGFLAGFPMTDFRATLYDGKYHDVDSSDIAFKIAGSLAFKEAMKQG